MYNEFSNNIKLLDYNYKVSKVLYKDSYNTTKYKIQLGNKDNVSKGLAVTNEYGLVGIISDVDEIYSTMTILKEVKDISVLVNDSYGKMNYDYNLDEFIIEDISNYDKVYVNDKVYTSGYGKIQEQVYIGKVVKVDINDISKKIYVKSDVDFNNLNYLLIVGDL